MIPTVINIIKAEMTGGYNLHFEFDDGAVQTIDFLPFLSHALHPAIRAYLDPNRFADFRIHYGELVWGDYDLCFPVADLYCNRIV
jgi:hypothetical protein